MSLDASQKKLEKTRNGVEVTGIGHKRGFKVKWSDEMRTEETVRGLAILVLRRLKKGEGSERDAMASTLDCEDDAKNDEESKEEETRDDNEGENTEEDNIM